MLNQGLEQPLLGSADGDFQVTFRGPGDDIDRVRLPEARLLVTPAIEAELNDRQRKALAQVVAAGFVASGWLVNELNIAYDTANRDLKGLADRGILVRQGQGRAARYVLAQAPSEE